MGQDKEGIIVCKMGANIVLPQIRAAHDWERHGTVLVHNIHVGNGGIAVVLRHLIVHGGVGAGAAVGRIAFHNGGVGQRSYQRADQVGAEIVAPRFTGGQLYRDASARCPGKCSINCHQRLG